MQELIKKKHEIINIFLKKGVLISSEILEKLNDEEQSKKIFDIVSQMPLDSAVLDLDIEKLLNGQNQEREKIKTEGTKQETNQNRINVKVSYKDRPKKWTTQDFVDYYNLKYKGIEKILKQHQELKATVSLNRIQNKKDKEPVSVIGMVNEKQITKNGNLMLTVEDQTGRMKVIINKNKPSLFNTAKDIVHDEVIGILGVAVGNFIFANELVWPDTPVTGDLKKLDRESHAIFLSDLHVGSSKFLPEDFDKFLKWINGEMGNEQQRHIANNIDYIFIAGDLVDGCGIYPGQDKELEIKDIYEQYKECARLLKKIPGHIPLIICPGNHDALRISEPQPILSKTYAKPMHELNNAIMVSNPSLINISSSENFSGFDVLMYHGYSFDYYFANVDYLRTNGGYDRPDLIMKFLLKRRHLAPTHTSTLYLPDPQKDSLVIDTVPDFLLSGHIHKSSTSNYHNTTMICGSCWQGKTAFQEKVGHNPEPSRVPIVNLKTRDVKILKFGQ
ncbi:MAG TPA: DNA-directed DNA polymerase II small subunit [Candidatus Nanoarchaeia archaeon]|nr:DNA-directed DNA polymerase II small subunit [Candidatus Nanoarchaeia archaeon]